MEASDSALAGRGLFLVVLNLVEGNFLYPTENRFVLIRREEYAEWWCLGTTKDLRHPNARGLENNREVPGPTRDSPRDPIDDLVPPLN